jgi:hypothetical protein
VTIVVAGHRAGHTTFAFRELGPLEVRQITCRGRELVENAWAAQRGSRRERASSPAPRDRALPRPDRVAEERRPHFLTIYGEPGSAEPARRSSFERAWETPSPGVPPGRCLPYGDGIT